MPEGLVPDGVIYNNLMHWYGKNTSAEQSFFLCFWSLLMKCESPYVAKYKIS